MSQNASNKTPAMILQEFTVKSNYSPPEYILTQSKTGTHENEFHYRVSVAGVNGIGFGRSKQVARHNAATKALEILAAEGLYDLHSNPVHSFDAQSHRNESDSPTQPPINHIGSLKDMCGEFKMPYPDFIEISDVGPPHCRVFTYECRMSSIVTQATANTKKQAKQLAARDMIDRIKNICPDVAEQLAPPNSITSARDDEVIKKYVSMTPLFDIVPNKAVHVDQYTETMRKLMIEKCVTFEAFSEQFDAPDWDGFLYILEQLELKHHVQVVQIVDPTVVILSVSLETPFSVMGVGSDEHGATNNAVIECFRIMETYMTASVDVLDAD